MSDQPVDVWRNDKYTDYSHDVDEDDQGIAWVSGRGGIRGYATSGRHRDPYQNRWRRATPFEPILVAGGGVAGTAQPDDADAQLRPSDGRLGARRRRQEGQRDGRHRGGVPGPARESGRIVLSDLTDSWGGEPASHSSLTAPYRMKALDTFHPILDTDEEAPTGARLLGALLRDRGLDARRGVVRPGPAAARHQRRPRRAPGRLLPRDGHRPTTNPDVELLGHGVPDRSPQGRPALPVRHEPRRSRCCA